MSVTITLEVDAHCDDEPAFHQQGMLKGESLLWPA